MAKYIELTQNKYAIVDDDDFDELNKFRWYEHTLGYAARYERDRELKKGRTILMHRQIMKAEKGTELDHSNLDKLDNRKENLRFCTRSQNGSNRTTRKDSVLGLKGVNYQKKNGLFRARITINNKEITLGQYKTAIEAAIIYNREALKLFGEFANINIFDQSVDTNMDIKTAFVPGITGYRGVNFIKRTGRYVARITINKKRIILGHYSNPKEGALAYNEAAKSAFGEKAWLNIIPE